jgi:predicted chitinase
MQGYIALISILIISALVVLIATSASLLGISESKMGLQENQASEALYLSTACAEEALMKLKENINYSGNETLTFERGSCLILPIEGTGNTNRIVKTTATTSNQTRKIKIEINRINPDMEISLWQEVTNF